MSTRDLLAALVHASGETKRAYDAAGAAGEREIATYLQRAGNEIARAIGVLCKQPKEIAS